LIATRGEILSLVLELFKLDIKSLFPISYFNKVSRAGAAFMKFQIFGISKMTYDFGGSSGVDFLLLG